MSDPKKPVDHLRDGQLKAAIWENQSEKGTFHSVTFAKNYRDNEGNIKDTNRFSGTDLLKLSRLAEQSYDRTQELSRDASRSRSSYAERQKQKAISNDKQQERDR